MTVRERADNVFFTSDTHFGHRGMIGRCGRNYPDTDSMDADLVRRWNDVVPSNGMVYHMGDVSFAKPARTLDLLRQLNGRIVLVRGNHDAKLTRDVRMRFEIVEPLLEINVERDDGTLQRITMCHYAMRVWNRSHYGAWQLHGHSHGSMPPIGKQCDVGVDCWGLAPVSFDTLDPHMALRLIDTPDYHIDRNGYTNVGYNNAS